MRLLVFNLVTDADDPVLGFTTMWINALAARCEALDVITMRAGRIAVAPNVRVYSVGKEKGYGEVRRAIEFYRILFGLLRQQHYDACFAHMMQLFAVMSAPLLKLYQVPITLWYAHKATGRMLQMAEKLVDFVVTSSPESFRIPSRKVHIIGQGIDTNQFAPIPEKTAQTTSFMVVSISRIAPVKRLEIIITAVKTLHEQGFTQVKLRIVGEATADDAPYLNGLKQMVRESHLDEAVVFTGGIAFSAVAPEYQQADVMVNMSATGSIDKAVLEAMACGLPVLTANESFQSLLAPWADLLFIPPESPEVLPVRLKRLATLPEAERAALGAELRQLVVEQHSIQHLTDQLMTLFSRKQPTHA